MTYENDEAFEKLELAIAKFTARSVKAQERALRKRLKEQYSLPDKFLDIAVLIWWDGKED